MSNFYIYNADRERIGVLQHDDAVQWLENYQSPGEVKIDALATQDNNAMLVEGNRVYNTETNTVARICHVDLVQTEAEELITVRADITTELLSDRVLMATEHAVNVEEAMYAVYSKNRRDLPLAVGDAEGYTEQTDMELTWGSVLDAEKNWPRYLGWALQSCLTRKPGRKFSKSTKALIVQTKNTPATSAILART